MQENRKVIDTKKRCMMEEIGKSNFLIPFQKRPLGRRFRILTSYDKKQ